MGIGFWVRRFLLVLVCAFVIIASSHVFKRSHVRERCHGGIALVCRYGDHFYGCANLPFTPRPRMRHLCRHTANASARSLTRYG